MRKLKLIQSPAMDDEFFSHLRFVEIEDAEFICNLRNDPSLNHYISKSSSDVEAQKEWIRAYKDREDAGEEFYFVICNQNKDFGVVRLYDFRQNSFSWGSWIILPSRPSGLVTYSALMVYEMGFEVLGFDQSHFDVRLENQGVINFHLRAGAIPTRRTELDQHFVFPKDKWPHFREQSDDQFRKHRMFHG